MFNEMETAVEKVQKSGNQVYQLAEETVRRVERVKGELAGLNGSIEENPNL